MRTRDTKEGIASFVEQEKPISKDYKITLQVKVRFSAARARERPRDRRSKLVNDPTNLINRCAQSFIVGDDF